MRIKLFRLYVTVIIAITISSCSSIPLSSMIKVATMDADDISAIRPSEVRVRLSVSEPVELKTKDVRLVLSFEHKDDSQSEFQYLLKYIKQSKKNSLSSFFGNEPAKSVYLFKFSKQSELEFNRYQKSFQTKGKPKRYKWTVYYYFKTRPQKGENAEIDMELKLANDDEFFYLLKGAIID
ncbi:MAG: hypothetical protein COA86_18105 [Kangiella sp.]|nr:MAG: hypothetical protein COA86_18105 [Kangiella sp.]